MQPVQRIRTYVTLAVRTTAVILILIGIYGLVQTALVWMWYGQVQVSYDFGFTWIGYGLGYAISGIALAIASGPLVRWLVPVRRRECPQCGYALKNLKSQTCPECGYKLGSD